LYAANRPIEQQVVIILFVLLVIVAMTAAAVSYFPYLDFIFGRKTDEEKYFDASPDDKLIYAESMIYSGLSGVKNDLSLLDPMINRMKNDKVSIEIVEMGFSYSRFLLRLRKDYLRVINGVYTLYALDELISPTDLKDTSEKYTYAKSKILIDDLGWSLYSLKKDEVEAIMKYLESEHTHNRELLRIKLMRYVPDLSPNDYRKIVIKNIESTINDLREKQIHHRLVAQGYRHLTTIYKDKYEKEGDPSDKAKFESYENMFKESIDTIPNETEKIEMTANYLLHQASVNSNRNDYTVEQLNAMLVSANKAKKHYADIEDKGREAKCYLVRGQIYRKLAYLEPARKSDYLATAKNEFITGCEYCEGIVRYDQIIKLLLELSTLESLGEKEKEGYARRGVRISSSLNDTKSKDKFLALLGQKHIILIRHGESEKNITETVNGEGALTEEGRKDMQGKAQIIYDYLSKKVLCFEKTDVHLYGYEKTQITQSMEIFQNIFENNKTEYNKLLKPISMGSLKNVKESSVDHKDELLLLKRWREGLASYEEVSKLLDETSEDFWGRAEKFVNMIQDNTCTIVICTTSIAIILTHYLINPTFDPRTYKHIDIKQGGIVHFVENLENDRGKYIRGRLTNVAIHRLDLDSVQP